MAGGSSRRVGKHPSRGRFRRQGTEQHSLDRPCGGSDLLPGHLYAFESGGGTNRYPFANGAFDYKIVYGPPTPANPNVNLVLQAFQETQQQLDAFTAGTGFAGATLAPYFGTGGYGIRFVATCQDATTLATIPCPQFLDPYEVVTNYNGPLPTNVAFLTDEDNLPYTLNILTSASANRTGDPTIVGHKKPALSGFQVVGGVTGTPPTITITSPTNTTNCSTRLSRLLTYAPEQLLQHALVP